MRGTLGLFAADLLADSVADSGGTCPERQH